MANTRPRGAPGLTRDAIVACALAYAARGELASLSLRRLADELQVTPMALYRHVRDKDEILEAVADRLLADAGIPEAQRSWTGFLEELALSLRQVLLAQPELTELITRQPLTTPAARARLEAGIDALRRAGFDADHAVRAMASIHTYTIGFCALEAGRRAGSGAREDDPFAATIEAFVSEPQFSFGLRALLEGLAAGR